MSRFKAMNWTLKQLLAWTSQYLESKGVSSPRLDGELMLSHVLGLQRIELYTQWDRPLRKNELSDFKKILQRRAQREPLAYLLGKKEFYSLPFSVGPGALIPRPETEQIVELGFNHLKNYSQARILDLATGSGCILLSLLHQLSKAHGVGVEISPEALRWAQKNAEDLQLTSRVTWQQQDLQKLWQESWCKPYHLITANLPYVSENEYQQLQPEIQNFEPKAALTPGMTGLEAFEWVLPKLPALLAPQGKILLEMGWNQGPTLQTLAQKFFPQAQIKIHSDLQSHDRILEIFSAKE